MNQNQAGQSVMQIPTLKKIIGYPYSSSNSWNWLPKVQNVLENKFANIEYNLNGIPV